LNGSPGFEQSIKLRLQSVEIDIPCKNTQWYNCPKLIEIQYHHKELSLSAILYGPPKG